MIQEVNAQSRVELMEGIGSLKLVTYQGKRVQKLQGNVGIRHAGSRIYSDEAYFDKSNNSFDAFGRVRIKEGDSVTITSRELYYNGNTRLAKLRKNVVFIDPNMTLFTDFLDYNRAREEANYYNSGRLLLEGNTEVVSQEGFYEKSRSTMTFYRKVVLTHPDFKLETDTLIYNTVTKVARIKGPSYITQKDGTRTYTTEGEFNTVSDQTVLRQGEIQGENFTIKGDKLLFEDGRKYYKATSNVELFSEQDSVVIYGDVAEMWKDEGITKIYGNPLMKKIMDADTFFLRADTLISIDDTVNQKKHILAIHNVKIYKTDIQGIADSLVYNQLDSTIQLFKDPVLWSDENQISADKIVMHMEENKLKKMDLNTNAFVISTDSLSNFNQLKGKKMIAWFKDSQIQKVEVFDRSESIWFVIKEEEQELMGMNKIESKDMTIFFEEGQLYGITFYENPKGSFIPPHEIEEPDTRLNGFKWRNKERPEREKLYVLKD